MRAIAISSRSTSRWRSYVSASILGMSLRLLKFSGGSVDDYAICRSS